jgi:hypothetical protein
MIYVTIGVATFYVSAAMATVATCMFVARAPGAQDGRLRSALARGLDALSRGRSRARR